MNMDSQKIMKRLKQECFTEITNQGEWFEKGTSVYAKEIDKNVYLVFVIAEDVDIENIHALIAQFDSFGSIGKKEPVQMMFYMSIKDKEDLHYFEKIIHISEN